MLYAPPNSTHVGHRPRIGGKSPGPCGDDPLGDGAVALSADPTDYRFDRPHGPLSGRARFGVLADLQRYFGFNWALIGNLGVDLLIVPMAKLFGLELGVKLIVMAIPPMTVAGMLWVAREVHHRLPPTVMFALPFAIGHPFLFGFVNFALSMALAFLAFGLWLRLGRLDGRSCAPDLRPLVIVVWLAHAFGWGVLGLMAFSAEAVRQHDKGPAGCARASRGLSRCGHLRRC